jgi:hypothetical protein
MDLHLKTKTHWKHEFMTFKFENLLLENRKFKTLSVYKYLKIIDLRLILESKIWSFLSLSKSRLVSCSLKIPFNVCFHLCTNHSKVS